MGINRFLFHRVRTEDLLNAFGSETRESFWVKFESRFRQ
jgi:hypothetical protein